MEQSNKHPPYWGAVGTLLWAAVIAAVYVAVGTVVASIYVHVRHGDRSPEELAQALMYFQFDGMAIAWSAIVTGAACGVLIVLAVKLRRGASVFEYLGLHMPPRRQIMGWLGFFVGFLILLDLATYLLGRPIVPEFMWRVYSSAEGHWILWIALIIAAPVIEELFFRGFLIKGLAASPIKPVGAVLVTSAIWAVIHLQYDLYGIASIFLMGLILGAARIKTGSTMLPIFLHAVANFVATIETAIFVAYAGVGH